MIDRLWFINFAQRKCSFASPVQSHCNLQKYTTVLPFQSHCNLQKCTTVLPFQSHCNLQKHTTVSPLQSHCNLQKYTTFSPFQSHCNRQKHTTVSPLQRIQNTEILLSMNNRNLPYDCTKDTSKITHSIIHKYKIRCSIGFQNPSECLLFYLLIVSHDQSTKIHKATVTLKNTHFHLSKATVTLKNMSNSLELASSMGKARWRL